MGSSRLNRILDLDLFERASRDRLPPYAAHRPESGTSLLVAKAHMPFILGANPTIARAILSLSVPEP